MAKFSSELEQDLLEVRKAAQDVEESRVNTLKLRAKLEALQCETVRLESEAKVLGECAATMPEDLGDWSQFGPRMQGLAVRIRQTHEQSTALIQAALAFSDLHSSGSVSQ